MADYVNIIIAALFFALFVAFGFALRKRRHPKAKKGAPSPGGQSLNEILGYDFIQTVSVETSSPVQEEVPLMPKEEKPEQNFDTTEPDEEEEDDDLDDEFANVQWQIPAEEEDKYTEWLANAEDVEEMEKAETEEPDEDDPYGNGWGQNNINTDGELTDEENEDYRKFTEQLYKMQD